MNDSLQIIALILGILATGIKIFTHALELRKNLSLTEGLGASQNDIQQTHNIPTHRFRKLLDLSFVLICSAFFALLLTDSLIISGKNPSPGPTTFLIVFAISVGVGLTMWAAWLFRLAELITGCLSVITLVVLIMSSGGPFFSSESDAVAGLSLLLPTVVLVTLAATMFIYYFGNPTGRSLNSKKRIVVSSILLSVVLISSVALGKALITDVASDPRTPKLGRGQALIQNVMRGSLADRRRFYRLASEINLAPTYQKYFRALRQEQQSIPPADTGSSMDRTPSALSNNSRTDKSRPTASPTSAPSPNATNEFFERAKNDAIERGDYDTAAALQRAIRTSSANTEVSKEKGLARANFLVSYFNASDVQNKEAYLIHRLEWIHPVGLESQSSASISLPGTTSEERFEGTGALRMFLALYDQPNLRQTILREFEYPEQIVQFFRERDEKGDSRLRLFGESETTPASPYHKPTLFPKFQTTVNNSQLRQQLTLPVKAEAYVAFQQYQDLSRLIIRQQFNTRLSQSDFERLTSAFNILDDEAQDAFLIYVINNKKVPSDQVYQMLLDLKDVNFDLLANSPDGLAVAKLISILEGNRLNDQGLQDLADRINNSDSRQAKDTFLALLNDENPEHPIKRLFQNEVFSLVDQIHKVLGDDKREFFNAVADPVWTVCKHVAETSLSASNQGVTLQNFPLARYLVDFKKLDDSDQSGLLQQLAISLYQPGGRYSLDPLRSLVAQARSWNDFAGFLCAALLTLPIMLGCVFLGGFLSRRLVARDRVRDLVHEELANSPQDSASFGSPVETLYGREDLVGKLRKLAERGWSTIGIVGRRGVGKSRLLHGLFRSEIDQSSPTIKVWVASPSKFEEEDFIHSIFERLALNTEATIAFHLKANPLSIRRIERRMAQIAAWVYVAVVVVLGVIVYEMYSRLTRSDIVTTWLPILMLVLVSVGVFIYFIAKLQPVNLSSWLQRDRKHNPHTVLLYKEVFEALGVLRQRRSKWSSTYLPTGETLKRIVMSGFAMLFSLSIGYIVLSIDRSYSDFALWLTLIIAGLSCWAWLFLLQRRASGEAESSRYGQSLLSLVANYRSFASTLVHRLWQGALDHRPSQRFSVLICIDELDKIVDLEEIRSLLRKIKAIFEIPGLYYYISMAEDTLAALYLGPSSGKTEIDSAFDHIVEVPPLPCSIGETIAAEYLTTHGLHNQRPRLAQTIAVVSYGIPRDIFRTSDEIMARQNPELLEPWEIVAQLRIMQAEVGYDLRKLSRSQKELLTGESYASALVARTMYQSDLPDESKRLILSLWVLSLIESASHDEALWREYSEKLSGLGYQIPIEPIGEVTDEIEAIHGKMLSLHIQDS